MQGSGHLYINDFCVLFKGISLLSFGDEQPASLSCLGHGYLVPKGTTDYGRASLSLVGQGFDPDVEGYGAGGGFFSNLTGAGSVSIYTPAQPQFGFALFGPLHTFGKMTASSAGEANVSIPTLQAVGGEDGYGFGGGDFGRLAAWGIYDRWPGEAHLINTVLVLSDIISRSDHIVIVNNFGQVTHTATADKQYLAEIIEAATAAGTASALGQFLLSFSSSAAAQSTIVANMEFAAPLAESMTASGALSALGDYLAQIDDEATATDTASPYLIYLAELVESAEADGSLSAIGEYFASVDGLTTVQFSAAGFYIDRANLDTTSRVWVVNMETGASSQYDNYGFNSFFERDGISYGVADDGIYRLDGDTDAGADIDALVESAQSDFGAPQKKRVVNVYAGVSSAGKMLLKVEAGGSTYIYEARSSSDIVSNNRFDIGRGLSGNYYKFTLLNQGGDNFDLETITFEPIVLTRKI